MGWEIRNGKRVYYRKVWDGGHVRSVYCGGGERGKQAARKDSERRAEKRGPSPKLFRRPKRPAQPPLAVVPVLSSAPAVEPPRRPLTYAEQRAKQIKSFLEWQKNRGFRRR